MIRSWAVGAVSVLVLFGGIALGAQEPSRDEQSLERPLPSLVALRESLPGVHFHVENGRPVAMFGTTLATGATPLASAQQYLATCDRFFGEEIGVLLPRPTGAQQLLQDVMFQPETGQPKFHAVRYQQYFGELPVFRSGVGLLIRNEAQHPVVLAGFNVKELAGFELGAGAEAKPAVTAAMLASVQQLMDGNEDEQLHRELLGIQLPRRIQTSGPELVIFAGVDGQPAAPQVALAFIAQRGSVRTLPNYQKYLVIASVATGQILYSEDQIVYFGDVGGTVSGRETSGVKAAECDPEAAVGLPYAQVQIVGGSSVFANSNGQFLIPHSGTAAVTVRSLLRGQYFEVRDQAAGNAFPQIDLQVTPPGPANFLHNPTDGQQFANANVNAYYESNVVRDFVLRYEPTFPTIATQTFFDVNTNINSTCNAYYDGTSINFYRAGGGCSNTSFSDVVYHEYGHHLVSVTGNGQGQLGEGSGDCVGVLIQDEPILGHGFTGNCGAGIRTAANSLQYPQSGAIHQAGQLLSGCVWDLRNQLIASEPQAYRDISAALFFGMLIVRGQMRPGNTTIDPLITTIYLQLDDDDANINNGTPHYQEIATAFSLHNMDPPPLDLLDFNYPQGRPEIVHPNGEVGFVVEVVGTNGEPAPGTGILHVDRGNGFEAFVMEELEPNVYAAGFPSSTCGQVLKYYVTAEATNGVLQADPATGPEAYHTAISAGEQQILFADDFETDRGWSVSSTATDGQWSRGVPVGGGDRGDPPTDADGSGACFLTDNVDGNSDVDSGNTVLTSPAINGITAEPGFLVLSYWRWYSNVAGDSPNQDTFVVQVSNNNGTSWVDLETVGPGGIEVQGGWYRRVAKLDMFTPSSQMRVRFIAADVDPGSVVEAAVDGVEFKILRCQRNQELVSESFNIISGTKTAGTIENADASDDQYLCFRSGRVQFQGISARIDFETTAPTIQPAQIQMVLEARVNQVGNVRQQMEAYNFRTNAFELVDSRQAGNNVDNSVTVTFTGDPSRFVNPDNGLMRTRLTYIGVRTRFSSDACIDQLIWRVKH